MLRMIAHNWSDELLTKILKNLRLSSLANTRLLLIDSILLHACHNENGFDEIPGVYVETPPSPLLPNMGRAKEIAYAADILVCCSMNLRLEWIPYVFVRCSITLTVKRAPYVNLRKFYLTLCGRSSGYIDQTYLGHVSQ